ncbi:MAG TPA: hypothetical protein VK923_17935 [Euzebyales bacterium]|nr:hypothetical protein [Euzebyales bacterium]
MSEGRRASAARADGIRRRLAAKPSLELTPDELRALADHNIDPDEVRRIAMADREVDEVSEHDRPTARDELEALVISEGDEPGQ